MEAHYRESDISCNVEAAGQAGFPEGGLRFRLIRH